MRKGLLSIVLLSFLALSTFAATPFKVTTIENGEFAPNTVWYTMTIGGKVKAISDNDDADCITFGRLKYEDKDLWCFVGSEANGFAIYNKQAGVEKVLASSTTMLNNGGNTYPTMQKVNAMPAGYVALWDFTSSDKIAGTTGYFMILHGTEYAVNNFGGNGKLAFWTGGRDAGSTVCITPASATFEISVLTGTFTASNSDGSWHRIWSSNDVAGFYFSTPANNMKAVGDYIAGYSGVNSSSTYTLAAPEGLAVASYSFDFVNTDAEDYELTLSVNGAEYKSSATTQNVNVVIEEPVRIATFTQSGENKGVTFSNFTVSLVPDVREPEPNFEVFPTKSNSDIPYRIPAIATRRNGEIVAVADYRHSRADIGMAANGRIDLHARISKDNGETWGDIFPIIEGKGAAGINPANKDMYVGFGDPCIVADRESDSLLVISCSGNVSFPNGQRNNHQGIAHFYSTDGEHWSEPVDRSESIYSQFDNSPYGPVRAMFVGSGKISQSKYIKVKDFYRIYCAVLVKDVNGTNVNFVLYSDDFGENWTVLGGTDVSPIPSGGDEPKADELPDGSVVISSRTTGGRIYNIFSYSNAEKAEGAWGSSKYSNSSNRGVVAQSNSTNGEILTVPVTRKSDGKPVYLFLQSVPFGPNRSNVGIYYKEFETLADFINPDALAADWDGNHQSSYYDGAYSTMTLQKDNHVGFLYEEDTYGTSGGGYTIVYKNYSIEYITDSAYTYNADVDHIEIVLAGIDRKADGISEGAYIGCATKEFFSELANAIAAYKSAPSYETYEAVNKAIKDGKKLEVVPNAWYRLRNVGRENETLYLKPEAARLTAGTSNTENADQLFSFVPTGEAGKFYLYNGNYEYYLGPLGANETQPAVTATTDNAGIWSLITRPTGKSSVVCQNKTGGNTGLHLASDNQRLVPWTNDEVASLWYIEPVDEFALSINEFIAVNLPFAMELPAGVEAYVVGNVVNESGVEFVEIADYKSNVIAECTPVVLAAESGEYTFKVVLEADKAPENRLKGVLKSKSVSEDGNIYVLDGSSFMKYNATLPANAAYYVSDSNAATLGLKVVEELTAIKNVNVEKDVKFYDLKGNEVKEPVRGIYVTSEGKKVFVL